MTDSYPPDGYPVDTNPPVSYPRDTYPPVSATGVDPFASASPEPESPATIDVARDEAHDLKEHATDAASDVIDTARDAAANVVDEATVQARNLVAEARDELRSQADAQQERVAAGLRSVSDELRAMAASADPGGLATNLVQEASRRSDAAATWLDARDAGSLLTEIRSFAAKRPGAFITGAILAGALAGRLTRSIASNVQDDNQASSHPTGSRLTASRPPADRLADDSAATERLRTQQMTTGDPWATAGAATAAGQAAPAAHTSTPVYSSIADERGGAVDSGFDADPNGGDLSHG